MEQDRSIATQSERDRQRATFLRRLHEVNEVEGRDRVNFRQIGQDIGVDEREASRIMDYLIERGLAEGVALGGSIRILPNGVDQVEEWEREAEAAGAHLVVLTTVEQRKVEAALTALTTDEVEDKLDGDDRAEFDADRETITVQLRSPRPKREIVFSSLRRMLDFAIQTGATVAGAAISKALGLT